MDLSTEYLGLRLEHPIVPGASPLTDNVDTVRRLEDAGAPCVVMPSLFEEQVSREQLGTTHHMDVHAHSFPEAMSYIPDPESFSLGPEEYLERIALLRKTVAIPVIASLNGTTPDRWLEYARLIQSAGAAALELNVYYLASDPFETGEEVEGRTLEIVKRVKEEVSIPVAVKLSPFYSSIAHFTRRLDEAGADGLVIFNRFYQPDIDIEELEVVPTLQLSESHELLLRLRWLAILSGRVKACLAVTGGVQSHRDVIKAVMAGAHAVQVVSTLLRRGPERLKSLRQGVETWMDENGYSSVKQMRGSMSLNRCPDPGALERANYMRVLQSWRP